MSSGATTAARQAKKGWGRAGRSLMALEVACGDVLRVADGAWEVGYEVDV